MNIIEKARALRKNMTPQEKRIWFFLKQQRFQGLRFRRQAPIGPYIPKKLQNAIFMLLLFPTIKLLKVRNRAGYYSLLKAL